MSLAFIITLESSPADSSALSTYQKSKTGKALARESDRLDLAARTCKVPAITALLSENQDALRAQLVADGFDPSRMRLPPEQWFDAGEGLSIVYALNEHVSANLNNFKQPNAILRNLNAIETLLKHAEKSCVKFHFTKVDL